MLYRITTILIALLVGGMSLLHAQDCPALVETALETANDNCDSLDRNEACYGSRNVTATLFDNEAAEFEAPADTVGVALLQSISGVAADPESGDFGVTMMRLQANLPNTLPGQSLLFVLVGDVTVSNAVEADEVIEPAEPIDVVTRTPASLYALPDDQLDPAATVGAGTTLPADGASSDNMWLRVVYDEAARWVPIDAIDSPPKELPAVDGFAPMQAFTFEAGVGDAGCSEAPNSLIVQGPQNTQIPLSINGTDVIIGSTVVFEQTAEDELWMSVIDGFAILEGGQRLTRGLNTRAVQRDGRVVGAWDEAEPITERDVSRFGSFERLRGDFMNYDVDPPDREVIAQVTERIQTCRSDNPPDDCDTGYIPRVECRLTSRNRGDDCDTGDDRPATGIGGLRDDVSIPRERSADGFGLGGRPVFASGDATNDQTTATSDEGTGEERPPTMVDVSASSFLLPADDPTPTPEDDNGSSSGGGDSLGDGSTRPADENTDSEPRPSTSGNGSTEGGDANNDTSSGSSGGSGDSGSSSSGGSGGSGSSSNRGSSSGSSGGSSSSGGSNGGGSVSSSRD